MWNPGHTCGSKENIRMNEMGRFGPGSWYKHVFDFLEKENHC